jgi:uncharacterized protein YbbC (DUF1343 family)
MRNLNFAVIALMSLAFLICVSNSRAASPVKVGAQVLHEGGYADIFGKHVGLVTNHSTVIERGVPSEEIIAAWKEELELFVMKRAKYLMYNTNH